MQGRDTALGTGTGFQPLLLTRFLKLQPSPPGSAPFITYAQRPLRTCLRALEDALQFTFPSQQPQDPLQPKPKVVAVQEPPEVHQHLLREESERPPSPPPPPAPLSGRLTAAAAPDETRRPITPPSSSSSSGDRGGRQPPARHHHHHQHHPPDRVPLSPAPPSRAVNGQRPPPPLTARAGSLPAPRPSPAPR